MHLDEEKRVLKSARKDTVAIIVAMIGISFFYAGYALFRGTFRSDNLLDLCTISVVTSVLAAYMFYRFSRAVKGVPR